MERRATSHYPAQWDTEYRRQPKMWEEEPIAPAHRCLGYWLRAAEKRVSRRFGDILKECHLNPSEWEVLRLLYTANPPSLVGLARTLGMTKGGVSKLINRLVYMGMVTKKTNPYDRRYRDISITPYVDYLVPALAEDEADCDRQSFQCLGRRLRRSVREGLKRVVLPSRRSTPRIRPLKAPPPPPAPAPETYPAREYDPVQVILDVCAGYG
jgi:DNA-binding MarR family transcriptional regulator